VDKIIIKLECKKKPVEMQEVDALELMNTLEAVCLTRGLEVDNIHLRQEWKNSDAMRINKTKQKPANVDTG
jgi:hypothetical protein